MVQLFYTTFTSVHMLSMKYFMLKFVISGEGDLGNKNK